MILGSVSASFRRCGPAACASVRFDHPARGPSVVTVRLSGLRSMIAEWPASCSLLCRRAGRVRSASRSASWACDQPAGEMLILLQPPVGAVPPFRSARSASSGPDGAGPAARTRSGNQLRSAPHDDDAARCNDWY